MEFHGVNRADKTTHAVDDVLTLLLTLVEKENKKRLKITDLRYDRPGSLDRISSSMLT